MEAGGSPFPHNNGASMDSGTCYERISQLQTYPIHFIPTICSPTLLPDWYIHIHINSSHIATIPHPYYSYSWWLSSRHNIYDLISTDTSVNRQDDICYRRQFHIIYLFSSMSSQMTLYFKLVWLTISSQTFPYDCMTALWLNHPVSWIFTWHCQLLSPLCTHV